jgi:serine/threonine-protein phosphatase 2B regulatory subunit
MGSFLATEEIACDLSEEEIEELHMISAFEAMEIRKLRNKFLEFSGGDKHHISQDEFEEIPAISINPLRERLVSFFEFEKDGRISWRNFVAHLAVFSQHGRKEQKLKAAFKIQDMNDDGKICKKDLLEYLKLVTNFDAEQEAEQKELEVKLESVAEKTLAEASTKSGPEGDYLSEEDFNKVVAPTDFASRLLISII